MVHRRTQNIQLTELPRSLDKEISAELGDYSVGIFRYRGADAKTYQCLGSGTLVTRRDRYGILLAHHCLHACKPQVALGHESDEKLVFVLRRSTQIVCGTDELIEDVLTAPTSDEWGPDLTFIQLLPGPRLARFKAVGSFWSLDRDFDEILDHYARVGTVTVCMGHPAVHQDIQITDNHLIKTTGKVHAFLGTLKRGARSRRGPWDYVQISANYASLPTLPETFGGVSGGGFWAVTFKRSRDRIVIDGICFVGVAFYQSAVKRKVRHVRGHYVRSVYDTAWQGSSTHDWRIR